MRSWKLPAALLIAAAAGFLIYRYAPRDQAEDLLRASGTIEATKVDASFQIGGRVTEVLAREGQPVHKDDIIARMAVDETLTRVAQTRAALEAVRSQARQQEAALELRRNVVEQQIAQATSQVEAARISLDRLRLGTRPEEIRVAESVLAQAEADLEKKRSDFQRVTSLVENELVSRREFEAARAAAQAAQATVETARQQLLLARVGPRREDIAEGEARLRSAEAGRGIAEAGRKEIDIQRQAVDAAQARARELEAQWDGAKTQLGYAEIRSPLNGVVLTKNVESGEFVNAGTPVATIGDINDLWMNLYIPETKTGLVRLGQGARIHVDSFPGETFAGKISYISDQSEFTPKTIQTEEERIKLVYRVKVTIENSNQRLKPGMPADAEILLH